MNNESLLNRLSVMEMAISVLAKHAGISEVLANTIDKLEEEVLLESGYTADPAAFLLADILRG